MDDKNDTNYSSNRQVISAGVVNGNFSQKAVNDDNTKAGTLPKQYGKMPFGITPHLTKLSAKALLLYVDLSQLFWGESNSLSLTTNPITDDGLAKRTGFSLAKTARARKELVDSGVVEIIKTAHADSGKLKRVFRFYQVGEMDKDKPQTEASNSQDRIGAIDRNEQHQLTEPVNPTLQNLSIPNQEKKSAKADGDSVLAIDSLEPLLHLPTSNNYYNNYYNPTQLKNMLENGGEDELLRIQQTYWQASDKDRMKGTLAELHAHIMQKFDFPSNYAFRLLEDVSKDKGETLYPQGYMSNPNSMAHLAQKAKPLQRQVKKQQEHERVKREEAKREEAEQQRKLELEHRESVFQGLGPQFDQDIQNSLKGVSVDSRVYYGALGKERLLEGKIDTFLRNSEDIIKPLYDKHIGTSLDSDDVIEREKALKERLGEMWDWNGTGTRLGDFCDLIKRKILSDEQLKSPFTLDDDSKPQPRDTPLRQMAQQSTKPPASDKTKAKPQAGLTPMAGGGFDEGLKQELIKQGIVELEADNLGPWANSMKTSKMLANAGMTSKELVKEVMSQAGDKSEPTSVTDDTNVSVQQDDDQSAKLDFETA